MFSARIFVLAFDSAFVAPDASLGTGINERRTACFGTNAGGA